MRTNGVLGLVSCLAVACGPAGEEDSVTPTDTPSPSVTAVPSPTPPPPPATEAGGTPGHTEPIDTPLPTGTSTPLLPPTQPPSEDDDGYPACPEFGTPLEACDCAPADPGIYPGAPEVCEDGVDQDCDGTDGSCRLNAVDLADEPRVLSGSGEVGQFGYHLWGEGQGADGVLGVLAYGNEGTTLYLLDQLETTSDVGSAFATWRAGEDFSYVDDMLLADLSGDGERDLLLVGNGSGGRLYAGPLAGDIGTEPVTTLDGSGWGQPATHASSPGDLDGDGAVDLVLGDPYDQDGESFLGSVTYIPGPLPAGEQIVDDIGVTVTGEVPMALFSWSLADSGDLTNDGVPDVIVGVSGGDSESGLGAAAVFSGAVEAGTTPSDADVWITEEEVLGGFGDRVAAVGDLNGDGIEDLAVGAPYEDRVGESNGSIYIFFGPLAGAMVASDADAIVVGEAAEDAVGRQFAGAGDFNGDGIGDLLVGAATHNAHGQPEAGAVYVVTGPLRGLTAVGSHGFKFHGAQAGDLAGTSLAPLGDINSDGYDDVAVGAPGAMDSAGAVWLLHGRAD